MLFQMPIVNEEDEYATCIICSDLKRDSPQWQLAGCGHTFCHICIQRMLRATPLAPCPLCRHPLTDQREALAGSGRAAPVAHPASFPPARNPIPVQGQHATRRDLIRRASPTIRDTLSCRRSPPSYRSTIWGVIETFDVPYEVRQDPNIQRMMINTLRDLESLPIEDRLNRVSLHQVFGMIFRETPPQRYSIAGFLFEILPRSAAYAIRVVPPSLALASSRTQRTNRPTTASRQASLRPRSSRAGGSVRETNIDYDLHRAIALSVIEAAEEEELRMALAMSLLEIEPPAR